MIFFTSTGALPDPIGPGKYEFWHHNLDREVSVLPVNSRPFTSWPLGTVGNFREVSSPIYQAVKVEGPSFPTALRASQKKQKKATFPHFPPTAAFTTTLKLHLKTLMISPTFNPRNTGLTLLPPRGERSRGLRIKE